MYSRKVFLDQLGLEFVGLTTTLLGIIGFLSLAEMGLSVAVSSTLYKPLAEKNYQLVNTTIDFLGKAYKTIGLAMVVLASIVALFIPYFFPEQEVELAIIYFAYLVFITSVVIEYVFNYRQIILSADQKNYVLTYCRDSLGLAKVVTQLAVIKLGMGEYAWLITGLITTSLSICLINRYVNKNYAWLVKTEKDLKTLYIECNEVVTKTKQLIIHKMAGFVLHSSGSIFIYKFTSLATVALIGNYQMLSSVSQTLALTMKPGLTASVGNFVSTQSNIESYILFKVLAFIHLVLGLFFAVQFYYLSDGFISIWLGSEYTLDSNIKLLIAINLFLLICRGVIDTFIMAYGFFHDIWAPAIELTISIVVSVVFGYLYGAAGVLSGTAVSVGLIVFFWKPYLIYKLGFKLGYSKFVKDISWLALQGVGVILSSYLFIHDYNNVNELGEWIVVAISTSLLLFLIFSFLAVINIEVRDYARRKFKR
jgi:O-antigen/teichoic acid export membrane protein